jgi:hypothetical protein
LSFPILATITTIDTMLFNSFVLVATASIATLLASVASAASDHGYSGPSSYGEWRHHHPYHHPPEDHRRKVYIHPSKNDTDDVSADFYLGLKKANHGGTLVLPKGQTFVIGKKLDLTFLNNVEVQLEGEILVCSCIVQRNSWAAADLYSSPTTSPTGKTTIFTIRSRSQSRSGNGEAKTSKYSAMARSMETAKLGMMDLRVMRSS